MSSIGYYLLRSVEMKPNFCISLFLACLFGVSLQFSPASAQVTPNDTSSIKFSVDENVFEFNKGYGGGGNLFYSFRDFSVSTGMEISDLEDRISALEDDIYSVGDKITFLEDVIFNYEDKISNCEDYKSALEDRISFCENIEFHEDDTGINEYLYESSCDKNSISALEDLISDCKDEISILEDKVPNLENRIDNLKNEISDCKDKKSDIEDRIKTYEDKISHEDRTFYQDWISDLEDEISDYENSISDLEDTISEFDIDSDSNVDLIDVIEWIMNNPF